MSFRPFALRECDWNHLDGSNISAFSDWILKYFQGIAQFCLKKVKDRISFKKILLRDRVLFDSRAGCFSDFPEA